MGRSTITCRHQQLGKAKTLLPAFFCSAMDIQDVPHLLHSVPHLLHSVPHLLHSVPHLLHSVPHNTYLDLLVVVRGWGWWQKDGGRGVKSCGRYGCVLICPNEPHGIVGTVVLIKLICTCKKTQKHSQDMCTCTCM